MPPPSTTTVSGRTVRTLHRPAPHTETFRSAVNFCDTGTPPAEIPLPAVSLRHIRKARVGHRAGFSILEVTATVTVIGILAALVVPPASEALTHAGVNRSAAVVAMDLMMASSLASRQRRPVRVTYSSDTESYAFTDVATGALLHTRDLGEFELPTISFVPLSIDVAPSGITSSSLTVTLATSSYDRKVKMMRAGMVRVVAR